MRDFVIMTDRCCDLTAQMAEELNISVQPLSLLLNDQTYRNYLDGREIGFKEFYDIMRGGSLGSTSAVSVGDFEEAMRPILAEGRDLLYIGFSSGLSGTFNAGLLAVQELQEKYPERKIYAVDSLCASMGQGLLVYLANEQKKAGKSIEEVRDYAEKTVPNLCHWFTVNDLMFLKRGGRVSATTAVVGSMLSIKPVMHVDDEGKLVKVDVARGRKGSLRALLAEMEKSGIDLENQHIFISHGDCEEKVEQFAQQIRERFHVKDVTISYVGPVIGAHTGPGVVALFFLGSKR